MLTWQKVAPIIILSYLTLIPRLIIIFILASRIVGRITGLNQTCIRKIIAYSSINHIRWMLSAIICSISTWLIYLTIYSFINMVIIIILKSWKIYFIAQINNIKNNSNKILFILNFFSLGGLPPFTGFIPKWITIQQLRNRSFYFLVTILIIFTLVTLFFYLRISFSRISLYSKTSNTQNYKNNTSIRITALTILPLIILVSLTIL